MLSLDLFATKFEKELREGAVDDLEYRRMNDLREKMEMLMQAYKKADTDEVKAAIMKRYNEYKSERESYTKVREQQVPSKQDPFAYVKPEPKGIGDIQDPRAKMAQLAQRAKKGPLANVGAGLKGFLTGKEEPLDEQELGRRGIGMTNIKNLGLTASKGLARTIFQFPNIRYVVDEDDSDKMVDYYNALDSAGRTNFVYNVLGDGMKFLEVCESLGIKPTPMEHQQPELPGMPQASPQRELPLEEKKKSNSDDLEAGDIKVARELQKLRAQYPGARSDVEAVARAEIDSTERSQRQLAAIRGANEKQDALLKQLVALDQEQGQEIDGLDKENNSLEQRLVQVQATNDRLQQAVGKMTGTKKTATKATVTNVPQTGSMDIAQGGIIDVGTPATGPVATQPTEKPQTKKYANTSVDQAKTDQTIPGDLSKAPVLNPITKADIFEPIKKRAAESKIKEHGGGIGPKKHWQSMMPEGQPQELINRYLAIDAETDVEAVRAAIQAISKDPALGANSKSRLLGQIGMIIKRHRLPIGRSYYTYMQQYMEEQDISETVTDVRSLWAQAYHKLAPKIERHRDSFLAGQLYDELENIAELHGAEGEFKRMMNCARNRAHMEYDTNPGGFHNWFWFLPFEDENVAEGFEYGSKVQHPKYGSGQVVKVYSNGQITVNFPNYPDPIDKKPGVQSNFMPGDSGYQSLKSGIAESTNAIKKRMSKLEALALAANRAGDDAKCKMYQQKIQSLKQKLSQSMAEGWSDQGNLTPYSVYIDGREWRAYKSDEHARAVAEKVRANLKRQGRDQTVTIAPSKAKKVNEAREIQTREDFIRERDRLLRMIGQETNPANKQILKSAIRQLENRAENEGWITIQSRMVREDSNGGEAVEIAIIKRVLVAHTDLIMDYGLDKVTQAIEEVAYDVGDVDEIGSSDVSGWVRQVQQILGVDA